MATYEGRARIEADGCIHLLIPELANREVDYTLVYDAIPSEGPEPSGEALRKLAERRREILRRELGSHGDSKIVPPEPR